MLLRSNLNASKRKAIIDDFNDSANKLYALLLNIKSFNFGLNLYYNYFDIIILYVADNIN
jgi:SNF2 family DNA or RNA helicase